MKPGYLPESLATLAQIGGVLAVMVALAGVLERLRTPWAARLGAWALAVGGVATVERLAFQEPAGIRMLVLCAAGLYGMKAIVLAEHRLSGGARLTPLAWLGFVGGWPGMRPAIFAKAFERRLPGGGALLVKGLIRLAIGAGLILAARLVWTETGSRLAMTLLLLPGISLSFHFGLFTMTAGVWRFLGADARELFRAPLEAKSLGEFWSRRWNLAFSEMIQQAAFRPLKPFLGPSGATLAGFALSALLHEMAISLPVRAGWGLPTAYFLLHGALVMAEKHFPPERLGRFARVWTLAWLALPLPLVFHRPFLEGVVWPMIGAG